LPLRRATYRTYVTLRDLDVRLDPLSDIGRLGQMASWARWGATTSDLAPITAAIPKDFDGLEPLTTSVVLFGINWGGDGPPAAPKDWTNFHTRGHGGDGCLKNSVQMAYKTLEGGIGLPAAYMTDVFKQVPTQNAAKPRARVKSQSHKGIDHVGRCAEVLREELNVCLEGAGGDAPMLVAMGQEAYSWLTGTSTKQGPTDGRIAAAVDRALGDGAHQFVELMPHYTQGTSTNVERSRALAAVLAKANSGSTSI
jgi:hypothetical protein